MHFFNSLNFPQLFPLYLVQDYYILSEKNESSYEKESDSIRFLVFEGDNSKMTIYVKNKAGNIIAKFDKDGKKRKRHYRIWHMLHKIQAKAPGFINSHEYKQLPKHLRLLHDKLCNKHTHFFIQVLESFEHEPAKKRKRFIYTVLQEKVTYEQLKQHLKLE